MTYLATIHHGINVEDFPFRGEASNYLLFFGRIYPEKGTAEAIRVANRYSPLMRVCSASPA